MKTYLGIVARILLVGIVVTGLLFNPQHSVFAAPILSVNPITWNVVGLDSNNVNDGPSNFPVGVRVCNTGDTPATNVTATFVWDSVNTFINLRSGSLNPIVLASIPNGACSDFYFEVVITRTAAAYDTTRQYHINVTADTLGTISTPTPREIYVEHLVSQNRNSVLDVQLDGVSVSAGGTMNLVVGNTYTIKLISDTATNGYEQLETFINFPNTIFQILNVTTTYTADAGTDPNAYSKLYADGCAWDNATRACTTTGKYGGNVTVSYVVKVISGGGTSQPLNTLIYDFSGSSYHYNSDFAISTRIANISDPASCVQQTIAQWTFNNTTAPSTGVGTFSAAGVSGPTYVTATGNTTNPALAYTGWDNAGSGGEYLQFAVSTVGYYAVQFSFGAERAGVQAPTTATVLYSTNGTVFTAAAPNVTLPNNGTWTNFPAFDFSSVNALSSNPNATFRLYAFGGAGGTQANRSAYFDNVTVTGCALPAAINVDKSGVIDQTIVAPTNETNVGDHINYTIVITNTGGVPLTNIILTDSRADSLTCVPSLAGLTLLPGQSVTCTGFHILTQSDFDTGSVTNLATADSDQVGPVSDSTTQTLPQSPALTLEKSADTQTYTTVGQQVTYTYTLTNSGNVTLTSPYSVGDNLVSVDCTLAVSPLLPGESTTCTATYLITQADINAGSVTNLATANATFGDTTVTSNQDSVTINYAGLNIIKEVSTDGVNWNDLSVKVNVGDTVYYRIRVENTGNVTLTGFTVDDGMAGCTLTREADNPGNNDANFESGETWIYTCSVVAVEGTQNNTATADTNETDQDSDSASYFGENPSLNVLKSETSTGPYVVGNTISYNIVVTNTGNVILTGVTIVDNSAAVGTCAPAQPATLAPGESMACLASHVVTQTDVDNGSYVNTATADSNETPPSESTVTVTFPAEPALSVVKSEASSGPYIVGDTINYNIVVTNTGNVTLTGVIVDDNSANLGTCVPVQPATLAPGESMTCPASHVVTQTDINNGSYINTATADSNETLPDNSSVTVFFTPAPSLSIQKTELGNGLYSFGETINYSIVVTNTGNITLTGVTVTDNSAVVGTCTPVQPSILAPGESMTCPASHVVTQGDVNNGLYVNTATADSNETPPSDDSALVEISQNPALGIVKSEITNGPYSLGATITYSIVVTNTGDVALTGVTVVDNSAVLGACIPVQPSTLAPGDAMTCSASHVVTQADVNNGSYINTATGDSNETPSSDSTVTVTLAQNPDITIIKSSNATGTNAVGDTITYTYDVENTGDVTLTNVTVTDAHVGLSAITCTPPQGSTLEPGDTMICTATYKVTQADVNAGQIDNTGVVTGTPPAGPNVTDNDLLSEPIAQNPQLDVLKSQTSSGPYVIGDTITYSIVATNTGNIALTGVTVTDNSAVVGACTPVQPASLAPGAAITCPASHVVTQTDVDNRGYVNTATADSNETQPRESTVTINFGVADLSLVKTVTNTTPTVSTNINFIITVTNGGPDDAVGVEVTEKLPSGFTFISATTSKGTYNSTTGLWQIGDLALNQSVTLNMIVRVNASGSYTNTAEITASLLIDPDSTPNNQIPSEDDQSTVTVIPQPREDNNPPPPTPTPALAPTTFLGGFLIPVTGFAPNVVTDLSGAPRPVYSDTSIMLDIPALSVDIPIVGVPKKDGSWNVSWLTNQAGWLEGSAFPSWNGNSVLTSHVYLSNGKPGPFAKLHELKTGDQVVVHAFGQKYIFEVQTNATIAPTDRSVMKHEERPWLTLVTCTDYDQKTGTYKNRFIVRAVLVKVSLDR